MGRPQADPSITPVYYNDDQSQFQPDQSEPQPQEYHYEPPTEGSDVPPPVYETYYNDVENQQHSSNPPENDPQSQQQFQQPPPNSQQPQNPQAQANAAAYTGQPAERYQPQTMGTQSVPPYPPPQQNPQMAVPPRTPPRTYPPPPSQAMANPQAQAFPPQSQTNPQAYYPPHQANNPQAYYPPPQAKPQAFPYQTANCQPLQPVKFPPPAAQMGYSHSGVPQQAMGTPLPNPYPTPGTEGWHTGLFDCMDDPTNALATAFFPCLTFGQIAEIIDTGHTSCGTSGLLYGVIAFFIGMPCLMSCTYRTKLRSRYGLVESPGPDWVTHFFCEWCALCQEYRELQHRGFDPSIGWLGNQQKQQQLAMVPPMNQTMMG